MHIIRQRESRSMNACKEKGSAGLRPAKHSFAHRPATHGKGVRRETRRTATETVALLNPPRSAPIRIRSNQVKPLRMVKLSGNFTQIF